MNGKPSLDTILQEALDISEPKARAAYLDECCGDDVALRRDVNSLLAAHFAAENFMATLADPAWGTSMGAQGAGSIPTIEELEEDFPELEIIELIGRGGMGAVFKARQASLDRVVALKVLPDDWNISGNFSERFEREAKILAGLNHPGIVTIHEFGERHGRYFFTMEFVDGTDLERMIRGADLAPDLALKLIPQICDAIQFAHDRGVVHRDIKPGNILVDRNGRVKVADFGIAKLGVDRGLDSDSETAIGKQADLTTPHGVVGTPRYMAPEQAAASSTVDHRADLYALGVVFYEMLVGSPPPEGAMARPPTKHGKLNRRWDRIIQRALAEDPERRYQNASEIRTAVELVLAEQQKFAPNLLKAVAVIGVLTVGIILWLKLTKEEAGPLVNSLEMEFVPVSGIDGLVSRWETRVRDYRAFVEATDRIWQPPSFEQTPEHPAVNVSWYDAQAFCQWLTEREREAGLLPQGEVYRLPTDLEWSAMASLVSEEGADPRERHLGQKTIYPWGEEAPIPEGAGNFPDRNGRAEGNTAAVPNYADGFGATAPVGRFLATTSGLHDLGGNVWEWTSSFYSSEDAHPVLRGGGWRAREAEDGWKSLLASYRRADVEATEAKEWDVGFRVLRGPEPEEESKDWFRLVLSGDLEGVKQAIDAGADVRATNQAGQPAIVLAADAGNLEMVQLVHTRGAKLEASDRRGRTALHAAAELGNLEMTLWLLAEGADARARNISRQDPLFLALQRAPTELLDALFKKAGPAGLISKDVNGSSALPVASRLAPDETLRWVIEKLSDEQIAGTNTNDVTMWTVALVQRDSSIMSEFLVKVTNRLNPEVLSAALISAICSDKNEQFSQLIQALGEDALDQQTVRVLGKSAVMTGRPWAIKQLISKGWDLGATDSGNGSALLHIAARNNAVLELGREAIFEQMGISADAKVLQTMIARDLVRIPPPATREAIRILAKAGVDLEARDIKEETPLISAAMSGNFGAVETLLSLGAEIEAKDHAGFTPLLCAVEIDRLDLVKELERRGADFEATDNQGRGVLHLVHRGEVVLRYLLEKALPLERKDQLGKTPLILLAEYGDEGVTQLLLDAGADVTATTGSKGRGGSTALHAACSMPDQEELEKIKERQVALGGPNFIPILPAERGERIRAIKLLVDHGADPMAKEADWMSPLHLAARFGLHEAVELFLNEGAKANALNAELISPLHLAARGGHLECVKALVEGGAVVDSPAWLVPVIVSAIDGANPEVVSYLVKKKAPIDRRDLGTGAYPVHLAADRGEVGILTTLLIGGSDLDTRDSFGSTPLHRAAAGGQREVVDFLCEKGAKLNVADIYGFSPADQAANSGQPALAAHLRALANRERIKQKGLNQ